MAKELVIEARVPLPDEYLDEVEVAGKAKVAADSLRAHLTEAFGTEGFKLVITRAVAAAPGTGRRKRSDAGKPRPRPAPESPVYKRPADATPVNH